MDEVEKNLCLNCKGNFLDLWPRIVELLFVNGDTSCGFGQRANSYKRKFDNV